jgi:hypothetical protein
MAIRSEINSDLAARQTLGSSRCPLDGGMLMKIEMDYSIGDGWRMKGQDG